MTVVIDCNIFVMCLTSRSPYHIIYKHLISGKYDLAVSEEILFEYEEVIQQKYSISTANALVALLKELPNVHFHVAYYKWLLIDADADDNKYSDCAIAGNANYLVTEDRHFDVLKKIDFPKIATLSIGEFAALVEKI
ncbi:MAG: putative toxin-antitoxin system toxin component, PIN family [Chitinophagaceae bacterium]|nr:putative toxin-antitoxin system toxin component, PIN family [Chitinophagaceae bacterium]MCW5927064.1 putative toxin-antitoxin system toxin component, PIN family [Chitinophagaceae bacterium]